MLLQGDFTTNYLPETYPDGFLGTKLNDQEELDLAAIAAALHFKEAKRARSFKSEKICEVRS